MSELSEPVVTIELEKTGERVSTGDKSNKILRYSLTSNYLIPADGWEVTLYDPNDPVGLRRKFAPWRRVRITVDGHQQVIGRIDETEGASPSGALTIRGRDHIADVVDCGADPSIKFTAKQDLGDAILQLCRPCAIRTLVGNFNLTRNLLTGKIPHVTDPTRSFKDAKLEDFKVGNNEGTFEVLDKIVARHGYTVQSGGARDILAIVEPQYGQDPIGTISRPGIVLEGTSRRNWADVPTVTIATGRGVASNPGSAANPIHNQFPSFGELAPNELVRNAEIERILDPERGSDELFSRRADWKKSQFEASDFVMYRPLFYEDKDARTGGQLERGIRRELSRRLKSTLEYHCKVRGHTSPQTGAIWSIDTMARISDEIEDVNEVLWCLERTLSNDGKGPHTEMTWIRPGSIAL